MLGGLDPKKMQAMMKQLGIAQEEIDAQRVIIECENKKIIIDDPSVVKIKMQGQENFQISGKVTEREARTDTTAEDIQTIIEKTGCTHEQAQKALATTDGDLIQAILDLS